MMASHNAYPDLSGITTQTDNPYDALLESCENDPVLDCSYAGIQLTTSQVLIQQRYETHRQTRNSQQRNKMLDPESKQLNVDLILHKLVNKVNYPDFADPRHCLVFWARPTQAIKHLISEIQSELKVVTPNFWFMPMDNLHMTALEITHSLTEGEISARVEQLTPRLEDITDYTFGHRTRLIHPSVSFDNSAIALSFVPATDQKYTYHHLRKDLYELCSSTGVDVESRYVVPSAHLTIGRFTDYRDVGDTTGEAIDHVRIKVWLDKLEEVNERLKRDCWDTDNLASEWIVGQEKGLDCNVGTLWYGNGTRLRLGKGF